MPNLVIYYFGIGTSLALLFLIFYRLRSKKYRERHAFIWILAGILALAISIFPEILGVISTALGFSLPTNFLFFISIVLLFVANLQTTSELTDLEEKTRKLAESAALADHRIEQLERNSGSSDKAD